MASSSQRILLVGASAAALAAAIYLSTRRQRLQKWRWVQSRRKHTFEPEDEEGDEQEAPELIRESKVQGAQKMNVDQGFNQKLVADRRMAFELVRDLARIPELDYLPTARYFEASEQEVLYPLIEDSELIVVPGAFFGDEGKGKTVDAIARHAAVKVVARVNSGENAGHTVFGVNGVKYDFHLCPSGLLTPGKVNVIGPECVMDPVSFMQREINQLIDTNIESGNHLEKWEHRAFWRVL